MLMLAGCSKPPVQTLPSHILGDWQTDDARYRGRGLKLDANRVTFGLGGIAPDKPEQIENVTMTPPDNPTDFVIHLRTADGAPDSIALQFTPANGGEMRIKSQSKMVWKRKNDFSRPLPAPSEPGKPVPTVKLHPVVVRTDGTQEHQTIYKIDCLRPGVCASY